MGMFTRLFGVRDDQGRPIEEGQLKQLYRQSLSIAWPSTVEGALLSIISSVDTMMVGTLGAAAIASVGLTSQPRMILLICAQALCVGTTALCARRKGANNPEGANSCLAQSLGVVTALGLLMMLMGYFGADWFMRLAGANEDTLEMSVAYFRIISLGIPLNCWSLCICAALRAIGHTRITMVSNMIANLVNVCLNYLLINGHFGFPKLGVQGAAIATVIGTVAACCMSIFSLTNHDRFLYFRVVKKIGFDKRSLESLANLGSSTLAEQIFLRIGFLTYSAIVARLGTNAFAAHQVGMNILSISFSFGDGLSVAAVALVGQSLGEKRPDLAKIYGGICQRLGVCFASILCVIFLTCSSPIFRLFSDDAEVLGYGAFLMRMISLIIFMQITQVIYTGCLRGGGDTKFTAFVSLISVAMIRPFSGWLFCYPLNMGLLGAWLGLTVDQLMRLTLSYLRFKSGKWTRYKI